MVITREDPVPGSGPGWGVGSSNRMYILQAAAMSASALHQFNKIIFALKAGENWRPVPRGLLLVQLGILNCLKMTAAAGSILQSNRANNIIVITLVYSSVHIKLYIIYWVLNQHRPVPEGSFSEP